jgi:hypothetical protein
MGGKIASMQGNFDRSGGLGYPHLRYVLILVSLNHYVERLVQCYVAIGGIVKVRIISVIG